MRVSRSVLLIALLGGCTAAPTTSMAPGPAAPGSPPPQSGRDPSTLPPPIELAVGSPSVRGFAEPEIINTRAFRPQIRRQDFQGEPRRPGSLLPPHQTPKADEPGPPNDLVSGSARPVGRVEALPAFPGISQTPWTPPDPNLAVGPNHVVVTVNTSIAWYLKDGTPQFEQRLDSTGDPGFFEGIGSGNFTFDPKCFYDPHAGRFVVLALEQYSTVESWITFAVSDDADPNGIWFKYRTWSLVSDGTCSAWIDYPGFGFDANSWYVTGNLFRFSSGSCSGFAGSLVRVIPKAGPLAGGTAMFSDLLDSGASWQVAQARDTSPVAIVRTHNDTQLQVARINTPLGTPSLATFNVNVPTAVSDPSAPSPLGTLAIVGSRVMNASLRANRLFVARAAAGEPSPNAGAVWNEIDMAGTPVAVQSGRVDGTGDQHLFFPALAVNDSGHVGMVFGRSSSTMDPRVETSGRLACDPAGTMSAPTIAAPGLTSPAGDAKRWGDYFGCTIDPVDGRTFWWIGEWQDANGWRTEVGSFRVGRRADIDGDGSVGPTDLAAVLAAFGTGGPADLDGNGEVNAVELGMVLADWGTCVGGISGP